MDDESWRKEFPEYAKYYDTTKNEDTEGLREFLQWIEYSSYNVMVWDKNFYEYKHLSDYDELLAEYHGINYKQAMKEREDYLNFLIEETRKAQDV